MLMTVRSEQLPLAHWCEGVAVMYWGFKQTGESVILDTTLVVDLGSVISIFWALFPLSLQMPKVQYRSNCKPSTFAYPPALEVPKEKEKEKVRAEEQRVTTYQLVWLPFFWCQIDLWIIFNLLFNSSFFSPSNIYCFNISFNFLVPSGIGE